jgi:hypothetical protein
MVAAPSGLGGFRPSSECVSSGRLWASLMAVARQTSWPPPGTELAACGQFFMAANIYGGIWLPQSCAMAARPSAVTP